MTAGSADEVSAVVAGAGRRGVVARGLGRSYGDAAQNSGGDVVVTTDLDRILEVDTEAGTVRAEAGVSLDRLMRMLVPLGLWPMVAPGTRQVTVGGAIGSDVHGKNHRRDGTFGVHVSSIVLDTPALGRVAVGPARDPELFWATTGGMGLTGVVLEATMGLMPIETGMMRVDSERINDIEALMARMEETADRYRYSVAWVDCLSTGPALGRGILELAEHARRDDLGRRGDRGADRLRFTASDGVRTPSWVPSGLLNRWTTVAFNDLWFHRAPRRSDGHLVPAASFFHPLDAVRGWNRIYGRDGFVQYQMAVPDGGEDAVRRSIERLSAARCPSLLGVLKRFGAASPGPLSFPLPGWTLALDIPAGASGLAALLDEIDELVVAAGGRVYLAKDSRVRPDLFEAMYPRIDRWRVARDRADPDRTLCSDLARRLPLVDSRAP